MNAANFTSGASVGTVSTAWSLMPPWLLAKRPAMPVGLLTGMTPASQSKFEAAMKFIFILLALMGVAGSSMAAGNPRDLNADGKSDLIWQNTSTGQRVVWYLDGTTFAGTGDLGTLDPAWHFAGTGDFNGDGKPDLVLQNTATGDRYVWFLDGIRITGSAFIANVPPVWQIAMVDDFNNDDKPDLVFQNTTTGQRVVWFMNGRSFAGTADLGTLDVAWQFVGSGDFNNDRRPDIVLQNTVNGDRYVWFMNGTSITGGQAIGNVPVAWSIAVAGDFNGDGRPDIVLQNTTTGERVVWFMNGASFAGGGRLGTIPTAWSVALGAAPGVSTSAATCYDGGIANAIGAEDPFYLNAWHLKNTGPSQVVSATQNDAALAGIDANVESVNKAGRGCTGKGISLAIVDSGLELAHEDLSPNILADRSFNFANNSSNPSPAANSTEVDHGTGVAGVAAARGWNGLGGRGTAPFASMVGYNAVGTTPLASNGLDVNANMDFLAFGAQPSADATIAATTAFGNRANGIDIFNYSAGTDYFLPASISPDPLARSAQHKAMEFGTRNLRAGRGAVYFQSAGNAFTSQRAAVVPGGAAEQRNCATFRTGYAFGTFRNPDALSCGSSNHEPEGKPFAYQVAAIHNTGLAASYSSAGAANWITGFGGESGTNAAAITTTDNSTCQSGSNNLANKAAFQQGLEFFTRVIADLFGDSTVDPQCNYTGTFNGTSAAAPSVSGVAALILEANPRLSWQDVGFILAKTARKVDPNIATGSRAVSFRANGSAVDVVLDDPWITNSAGFNFQSRYGFGLVDADAAVRLAARFTEPAGRRSASLVADGATSTESVGEASNGLKNYKAMAAFSDASAVSGQVRVDIAVTNTGDVAVNPGLLQFEIVNRATGTKSILLPAFTAWYIGGEASKISKNGLRTYRFHTNAFYGEPMQSGFEVTVRSFVPAQAGLTHSVSFKPTLTSFSM